MVSHHILINLRLILVSGKTKEFLFSPSNSAADITQHVYDSWPQEWTDEQPPTTNILRLIYQGRFLHGNVTLGGVALQLPLGKTTVMHLVARENLPEPNNQVVFLGTANLLNLDIVGLILSVEPAGAAARTRSGELQAKSRANRHQLAYKYYVWQWGRCPVKWQY
ncbi:hypothetical protein NP493_253g00015 [Ridgeia piscesae]|uniref:Ubiquitin-like domain-containing protein n=1 Tax=Ridgeia piscesae TaxID=27915 RepID=A0AAD9NYD2_RIDPI|nr:hypothetical protein NP493_253g00015 [Ridgeia piscesae]